MFRDAEVALPGLGFSTAIENVPGLDTLPVEVNCVEDTKVVASAEPSKSSCAPLANPLPFAVIVNVPVEIEVGEILVSAGTAFQSVTGLLPVADELAELTARIVTVFDAGTAAGAE